eukprot:UN01843
MFINRDIIAEFKGDDLLTTVGFTMSKNLCLTCKSISVINLYHIFREIY